MPRTDDLISDIDDFQDTEPPSEPPEAPPQPVPPKKSKKKSKKYAPVTRRLLHDEEDVPYAKSVTPSPPSSHGVKLEAPPAPPPREPEPEPKVEAAMFLDEPLEAVPVEWEEDTTVVEEPEPLPKPSPAPPPAPPPTLRSPRPAAARPALSPVSPPYRPVSLYGPSQQYTSLGGYRPNHPAGQYQTPPPRRESFAKTSPRPRFAQPSLQARLVEPPPPHMPQSHFFGLPDLGLLNLAQKPEHGKLAGADGYCCVFDSFADTGDAASARKARDALLVGSECGLDVYRVLPDKLEVVGRLEGLRGAVIGAKVLPHTDVHDTMQAKRPLVALIVHGPMSDDRRDSGNEDDATPEVTNLYQTTIEVYSLQTQRHLATLFKSTTVSMEQPVAGHISLPPAPVGELSLDAAGSFVTVSSGKSGEIFLFSTADQQSKGEPSYRCIGKFWTALQQKTDPSRPVSSGEGGSNAYGAEKQYGAPLFSLSRRWLAVVPPYTSASVSILGTPSVSAIHPQPYGLTTHVAAAQPPITCEVAGIDAEGTLSWLSRKAAQGLVKASQKGYEMGLQGWRELTHPSPPSNHQSLHQRTGSQDIGLFPPTNAPADDPRRLAKEPALVSIIDLQKLLVAEHQRLKQAPTPLATFALVEGCNHLSFSPDGVRLLTSTRKGEFSTVWDLAHIAHGKTTLDALFDNADEMECSGPHVVQIHRITRSSPSIITDSVWSQDGEWLALLTTHGTAHLHEIPLTAPSKKRKRGLSTTTSAMQSAEKADATVSVSQPGMSPPSSNGNGFIDGWRSWSQSVSTQVHSAIKTQNVLPTSFAGFRETATAAGLASRKAVTKGLGQGLSAAKSGASDMWHAEDNKVRLKSSDNGVGSGCLRWVQRQGRTSLAVVCGGSVYLHPIQRVTRRKGDEMVSGLKRDRHWKTFALPKITTGAAKAAASCAGEGPHGFWSLRHAMALNGDGIGRSCRGLLASTVGASEVETNPPYCPFHIDTRVNIYAFDDGNAYGSQTGLHSASPVPLVDFQTQGHGYGEAVWVFGGPLPSSTKVNDVNEPSGFVDGYAEDDLEDDVDATTGQVESRLTIAPAGDGGGVEQIRVNSRRSRRGGSGGGGEGGGFDLLDIDDDEGKDWSQRFQEKHFAHQQSPIGHDLNCSKPLALSNWEYEWQRDHSNHALSIEQCDAAFPKLYEEISRAVRHWETRNITPETIELYDGNEAGVRVLLRDQQLRIVQTRGMFREDFRQRILAVLHQLHRAIISAEGVDAPFDDLEITFVVDDRPTFPRDGRELATWSFARNSGDRDHDGIWLIPDFNFWSAPPAAGAFQEMQAKARNHDSPIADKQQLVVWRGVDWTNPEVRGALLDATVGQPWADVKTISWEDHADVLDLDEFCRYAYVVNTEGRSWSSRLTHLLNCDSVPVSHDLAWVAHYYHLLKPDINFVSVSRSFLDLGEKIEFYLTHPDIAQDIANRAKTTFRERYTTPAATTCYWRYLLRSWSSVAFTPEPFESAGGVHGHKEQKLRGITFEELLYVSPIFNVHDRTADMW
ncbi:hypothetical protein LTR08_002225 [Meristemomyces frigidus]|nr:hypothetical protein LTR08_002225 [Meristemomyces frigidus]